MTEEFGGSPDDGSPDDVDDDADGGPEEPDLEIELIQDGEGIAIIGIDSAVERFLSSFGSEVDNVDWRPLKRSVGAAGNAASFGAEVAANSGRWMKLTEESAAWAKSFPLVKNSTTGHLHATARAKDGPRFVKNLQFESGAGKVLSNPANLANAGAMMTQLAMQQTMDEIVDYLQTIDEKVGDVLRSQKDAVIADMVGVDLIVADAMTVRDQLGRLPEVTWSQLQSSAMVVARTQAYALRQLDGLAEKVEQKSKIGELAKSAEAAAANVHDWLAVLARCFQLQEAIAILELDRVFESSSVELDQHRAALQTARDSRRSLMANATAQLLERMAVAAERANSRVLFNPSSSPSVVQASNEVGAAVTAFRSHLAIGESQDALAARRWTEAAGDAKDKALDAAGDAKDKALEVGADGVDAAKRVGAKAFGRVKSVGTDLSGKVRRRGEE